MASSIIFIGSHEKSSNNNLKHLFCVNLWDVLFRIFASFVPPVTKGYRKIYVDFLGPSLALTLLTAFINYGNSLKLTNFGQSPTESLLIFSVLMPVLSFILCKLGRSSITLCETASLTGYALYGHLFTLVVSFLCFEERSNFFFFVCLIFFGGLSTLRVALVVLGTIPVPAARLLICTIISVVNILYLIFVHFAYMHHTFTTYRRG